MIRRAKWPENGRDPANHRVKSRPLSRIRSTVLTPRIPSVSSAFLGTPRSSLMASHPIAGKWRRLLLVFSSIAVLVLPLSAPAQFIDPRNYENFPVGVNQLELAY